MDIQSTIHDKQKDYSQTEYNCIPKLEAFNFLKKDDKMKSLGQAHGKKTLSKSTHANAI